jgi:hypothetical protein
MSEWKGRWVWIVWEILGILTLLSGFFSGNVVTMIVGVVMALGNASLLLTSYVSSDHIVKRSLEVILMLLAFGVVVYGYVVTGSVILGVMTMSIVVLIFIAFVASYLLPRIRVRSRATEVTGRRLPKIMKQLKEWFKGYDDAPLWLCSCRFIFAVATLSFIVSFFGPAILSGDLIGFWLYRNWTVTHAGFLYTVVTVVAFTLAVISGVPTFVYERKRMKELDESAGK